MQPDPPLIPEMGLVCQKETPEPVVPSQPSVGLEKGPLGQVRSKGGEKEEAVFSLFRMALGTDYF